MPPISKQAAKIRSRRMAAAIAIRERSYRLPTRSASRHCFPKALEPPKSPSAPAYPKPACSASATNWSNASNAAARRLPAATATDADIPTPKARASSPKNHASCSASCSSIAFPLRGPRKLRPSARAARTASATTSPHSFKQSGKPWGAFNAEIEYYAGGGDVKNFASDDDARPMMLISDLLKMTNIDELQAAIAPATLTIPPLELI